MRLCAGPLRRLGHIYKAQENPHRALECFQAICDAPPPPLTQADVWFLIGSVQETMEPPAPEFARQAYVHVLRLMQLNEEAKVARVYRQLGWVCHKFALDQPPLLGILNPAEAQAQSPLLCLNRALETEPMDAPNWHMLGACLLDHRELDAAYDCLRHAITLEPTSDKAWRSVGDLYLAQGEREDAIEAYEQAVHLNPSSHAWFDLGAARHDALAVSGAGATSMITAAVEAYTRALTICPDRREDISRRLQHLNTISVNTSMPSVSAAAAGCAAKTAPATAASVEGPSILHAAAVHMAAVADGGAPAPAADGPAADGGTALALGPAAAPPGLPRELASAVANASSQLMADGDTAIVPAGLPGAPALSCVSLALNAAPLMAGGKRARDDEPPPAQNEDEEDEEDE